MVRTGWLSPVSRGGFAGLRPRSRLRNSIIIVSAAALIAAASGAVVISSEKGRGPDLVVGQALAVTAPGSLASPILEVTSVSSIEKLAAPAAMPEPAPVATPEKVALAPPEISSQPQTAAPPEPLTFPQEPIAGSVPPRDTWQAAVASPAAVSPETVDISPPAPAPVRTQVAAVQPRPFIEKAVVVKPNPLPPVPGLRPVNPTFDSLLVGKWVPHPEACLSPDSTEYLPLLISRSRATAGEGSCEFLSKKQDGRRWNLIAECSDGQSGWTSNVSLGVAAGRLTWTSERGTQSYVRCEPTVVAKAATKERLASNRPAKKVARLAARKPALGKPAGVRVTTGPGSLAKPGWAVLRVR